MSPAQRSPRRSRRGEPAQLSPFVFDPSCLVWTSRAEVASALLSAVDAPPERALRAMELCAAVATPAHAPALLAVARARDRPYWLRVYAIRALAAAEAPPAPDDAVESLFAEWFFERDKARAHGLAAADPLELRDVLPLVATPAHERIAMRWLARAPPDGRATALVEHALAYRAAALDVFRWLGDEWRARGGAGCSEASNLAVARHVFPAQPEGAAVLTAHWADAPSAYDDHFALDRMACPALAGGAFDERCHAAAWRLALPAAELARRLGPRGLRHRVRRAVEERSRAIACPPDVWQRAEVARTYRGALAALRDWGEGAAVASGFLRGLPLDPAVRADLVGVLLRRDPAAAIDLVASRLGAEDDLPALRVVLEALGDSGPGWREDSPDEAPPVPAAVAQGAAARALATRSLRVRDPDVRYLAVGAAEATGAGPVAWRELLSAQPGLAHDLVRVRMNAALARAGDGHAEAHLARATAYERRVEVRAEALRRLGELPRAAAHRDRFADALAHDHARHGPDGLDAPAAEQAALALARIGDAPAKTALLRGAFGPLTEAAVAVTVAGLRAGPCEDCGEWPCGAADRRRAIAVAEGWRLTRWSPLRASRFATADD